MTESPRNVRISPHTAAGACRSRRELKTPMDHSSHGWLPSDRAPRLRRVADLVELQAEASLNPDRARRLARDMRIRAAAIELGAFAGDGVAALLAELAELQALPVGAIAA